MSKKKTPGAIALVGTGPGDAALLTQRATQLIEESAVVGGPAALVARFAALYGPETEERADASPAELVTEARAGRSVVFLVEGDVLSTSAGTSAAQAFSRSKLPYEVVPGIPVPLAVATYAGVAAGGPVTVAEAGEDVTVDWAALASVPGTVVLTLPANRVGKVAAALAEHGRSGSEPAAVTVDGTTTRQHTVVGTLDTIGDEVDGAKLSGEATFVVGRTVATRDRFSWWESRPLFGLRVLVPRTRAQAGETSALLRGYGADPLEVPTIGVEPPRSPAPMERAIKGLVSGRYQWVAFTSTNAVKAVREQLEGVGLDARSFAGVKIAAVGTATAETLADFGLRCDLLPSGEQSSEGLLADFPDYDDLFDPLDRVFLPRADIATETLVAGLKERGWAVDDITAYRTVRASPPPAPVREAIKGGKVDAAMFTSSSTVRNLVGIAGKPHDRTVIACIGPATAATAAELGLRVDVTPREATVPALAAALADFMVAKRAEDARLAEEAALAKAAGKAARPKRRAGR
ncbi:MAG TPA: uroporphyrinogen-III synthase [Mycobacteriales bacterium]